jgi:hypothetical protein
MLLLPQAPIRALHREGRTTTEPGAAPVINPRTIGSTVSQAQTRPLLLQVWKVDEGSP